jgi:hypothetical protein
VIVPARGGFYKVIEGVELGLFESCLRSESLLSAGAELSC